MRISGNYRYFISFMLHVIFATWYVSYLAAGMFFQSRDGPQFYDIEDKRTYVAFTFLVCSAISCPVFLLAAYHLYLVFSAQTTIEFWGNCQLPDRFKKV